MSRQASAPRWVAGLVVLAVVLTGACGSGATQGPGGDTEAAGNGSDAGGGGGGDDSGGGGDGGGGFSWNLPVGPISPDDYAAVYNALRSSCDAGAAELATVRSNRHPVSVALFDAAIAICRGDVEAGRSAYRGPGPESTLSLCLVNEAVLSVLEQRPQTPEACGPPDGGGDDTSTVSDPDEPDPDEATSTSGSDPSTAGGGDDGGDDASDPAGDD